MTVEREVASALKWAGVSKFGAQLISWAVTLIVLRILQPEDYGLMAIVSVIVSILGQVAELGLGASIVQVPQLDRNELARVNGLVLAVNGAIFVLVLLAAPLANVAFADERMSALIRVTSIQFLLIAFGTLPQSLAYRELDFKWLAWVELAAIAASAGTTLSFAWHGFGVWALVYGSLMQSVVRTAMLLRRGFIRPEFAFRGLGRFLRFGGAITFSRLAWQVVYQCDVLIAGRRLTAEAVGLYSVSLHLATLPMQKITGTVNQVAFPAVARLQKEPDRLRQRLVESTRLITVFSIAVMWGMSCVAPELVRVVLGAKWEGAIFPLQAICLIVPMRMIHALYGTAIMGIGQTALTVRFAMVNTIVLPVAFFVGSHWGPNGIAASWLIAIPLVFSLNFTRLARVLHVGMIELGHAVWTPVAAGVAMYGAVLAVRALTPDLADIARLPILIGTGAAVYLGLLNAINPAIKNELMRIVRAARG